MSNALKLLRTYSDMKAGELARALGISNSYLSEIETGKKKLTIDLLKRYSEVFDTSPSAILAFTEQYEMKPKKIRETIRKKIIEIMNNIEKIANEEIS